MRHDPMIMVRSDLLRRIDGLADQCGHISLARMAQEVDAIRHIARVYGLEPLERLSGTLESALGFHGGGAIILSYLDLMRDAVDCNQVGPEVSTAYLAAVSLRVRLSH